MASIKTRLSDLTATVGPIKRVLNTQDTGTATSLEEALGIDGRTSDITVLSGPTWRNLGLPNIWGLSCAYSPAHNLTISFGGRTNIEHGAVYQNLNRTYSYNRVGWSEIPFDTPPAARYGHKIVFDGSRQKFVLFGGIGDGATYLNDTWELSLVAGEWVWAEKQSGGTPGTHLPSARAYHSLYFDAGRNKVLLCGGTYGSGGIDDIWEWNPGQNQWDELSYSGPALFGASMVYVPGLDISVLFGGNDGASSQDQTYAGAWNGLGGYVFEDISPVTSPGPRDRSGMVFDGNGSRILMFGGMADGTLYSDGLYNDLWELTMGETPTWTEIVGSNPSSRGDFACTYDMKNYSMIIAGGSIEHSWADSMYGKCDTWEYFDSAWLHSDPGEYTPPTSTQACMVYNEAKQCYMLYGGDPASNVSNGYEYYWGVGWQTFDDGATYPGSRYGHSMAYDMANQTVVLFGGIVDGTSQNDTWHYSNTGDFWEWELKNTSGTKPASANQTFAYDRDRQKIVQFGGYAKLKKNDGTCEYDAPTATWSKITKEAMKPTPRELTAMAYDHDRQLMVLFGGSGEGGDLNDTWEGRFVGGYMEWTQVTCSTSPPARCGHQMFYHYRPGYRGYIYVLAGDGTQDAWRYDYDAVPTPKWTEVAGIPEIRDRSAICYDTDRQCVLLFGGANHVTADTIAMPSMPTSTYCKKPTFIYGGPQINALLTSIKSYESFLLVNLWQIPNVTNLKFTAHDGIADVSTAGNGYTSDSAAIVLENANGTFTITRRPTGGAYDFGLVLLIDDGHSDCYVISGINATATGAAAFCIANNANYFSGEGKGWLVRLSYGAVTDPPDEWTPTLENVEVCALEDVTAEFIGQAP